MITIDTQISRWSCLFEECHARCCRREIVLTLQDIKRIGKSYDDFYVFNESDQNFYLKKEKNKCIFLKDDLTCKINEVKPIVCRLLPFKIHSVQYTDEVAIRLSPLVECPGYEKGMKVTEEFMDEIEKVASIFLHEFQKTLNAVKEKGQKAVE